MLKIIFFITFVIANIHVAMADELTGFIYGIDDKEQSQALPNANIQWLGTKIGALSNKKGEFKLKKVEGINKLVVRYIGYKSDTITVDKSASSINIKLKSDLTLDAINVTGNKPESMISKSDFVKSETITSKGLQKAACCNLAESFVTNASVDVEYTDAVSGAKQIQLLGLQGVYSQMLIENVPDLRGVASKYGLSYIPGPWMESISISKGTSSVINGFESISGQINVGMKKPEVSKPFFANVFADQTGRVEFSADGAMALSDNWSTSLLIHGNSAQNSMDFNGDHFIDHPMVQQVNVMNRWNYQGTGNESVSLVNLLYEDRQGGQMKYFPDKNTNYYGSEIKTTRFHFVTKNGFFFQTETPMNLGTILSYTYHNQNSFYGKNIYNAIQNTIYFNSLYQINPNETNQIISGVSFQYDGYKEFFNANNENHEDIVPGVYTEYNFTGIKDLVLVGGLRVDNHNKFGTFITPRFHAKYSTGKSVFRASIGKGYRNTNILAENTGLMATSRKFAIDNDLKMEEALNFGLNTTTSFDFWDVYFTLNVDYYRTNFINQVMIDLDKDFTYAYFYNLKGESFSNSFQIDLIAEPLIGLTITLAYRLNDVEMTLDNKLQQKPLTPRHKGFLNASYTTENHEWSFDYTIAYNGGGRLPNTSMNPVQYQLGESYPAFYQMFAQITKRFAAWDIYLGVENLTGFEQNHPILAYDDPFGKYFDSSMIWGPITAQKVYMGIRLNLFNN